MVSAIIASYIAASFLRPTAGGRIVACPVLIVPAKGRKTGGTGYFAAAGRSEVPHVQVNHHQGAGPGGQKRASCRGRLRGTVPAVSLPDNGGRGQRPPT